MTGRVGPRLGALLWDLGLAHTADPAPLERAALRDAPAPGAALPVLLRVSGTGGAGLDALTAAGLHVVHASRTTVVGDLQPSAVPAVLEVPGVEDLELEEQGRPEIHSSVPAIHADVVRTGTLGLDGTGVIVGVVDSGIDIYHHAFRKPDGTTRLLGLLDTTAPYTLRGTGTPAGGTFTISWVPPAGGSGAGVAQTTAALPFDATVQQVLAALVALPALDPGDVLATGGPLPGADIVIAFAGRYLRKDVDPLTITSSTTPAASRIVVDRGREYTPQQINAVLAAPGAPFGSWDEDGHGTHVMGIAAGDGSQSGGSASDSWDCHGADYYVGVAPKADLVAVKTTFSDAQTIRGVDFVFAVADAAGAAIGRTVPAVVNLSTGGQAGARDGTTTQELHYDTILNGTSSRVIIKSAGNAGARYDHTKPASGQPRSGGGTHARKTVPAGGSVTMTAVVVGGDRRNDWFDLWYAGAGRISLTLTAPDGSVTPSIVPDAATRRARRDGDGRLLGQAGRGSTAPRARGAGGAGALRGHELGAGELGAVRPGPRARRRAAGATAASGDAAHRARPAHGPGRAAHLAAPGRPRPTDQGALPDP